MWCTRINSRVASEAKHLEEECQLSKQYHSNSPHKRPFVAGASGADNDVRCKTLTAHKAYEHRGSPLSLEKSQLSSRPAPEV